MARLRKRDTAAILQSLGSGVVPRVGIEDLLVGRTAEIKQTLTELAAVQDGASYTKFLIGPFGSGKSFMLTLIRQLALSQKFVVVETDFTPDRRLYGEDKGVATYMALLNSIATQSRPDGQALQTILEKWISQVQLQVVSREGLEGVGFDTPELVRKVQGEIRSILSRVEELTGGFDFAEVVNAYYRGYVQEQNELCRNALRWLRGEYRSRTDARRDLGVRGIVDDNNWYDHLKVVTRFVTQIGYGGMVVLLDEAVNLYKISHAQNRAKNYELILNLFNEAQQGRTSGLYILFGGTPEFLQDERRGLASYEALKSRLSTNRHETEEFRDLTQPVMVLQVLRPEEQLVLLDKVRTIHASHYEYEPRVTNTDCERFLSLMLSRPGARDFITVRDIVREFVDVLNILHQNPSIAKEPMFESAATKAVENSRQSRMELDRGENHNTDDPLSRFSVKQ